MPWTDLGYWAVLVLGGLACGLINTLASSGSAVSLPLLVALGIPDGIANATNRLPVLVGGLMASWTFARKHLVDWRAALMLAPPALIGSVIGVWFAELLGNRQMGLLITGAVMVALLLLFTKVKEALSRILEKPPQVNVRAIVLMFFVGLWLGLIVLDGATYLMLVLLLVCGYQLAPANALKSIILAVTTLVPVALFWKAGDILWAEGLVMAGGSVAGGHIGARLSSHIMARVWTFRICSGIIRQPCAPRFERLPRRTRACKRPKLDRPASFPCQKRKFELYDYCGHILRDAVMRKIQLRDAKASLSEVVDAAMQGKPSVIIRRGKPQAVVVSYQ